MATILIQNLKVMVLVNRNHIIGQVFTDLSLTSVLNMAGTPIEDTVGGVHTVLSMS